MQVRSEQTLGQAYHRRQAYHERQGVNHAITPTIGHDARVGPGSDSDHRTVSVVAL